MRNAGLIALALFLWGMLPLSGMSQQSDDAPARYSMIFRGEPIEQAIKQLVDSTQIDLIYDANLLGEQQIYSISTNKTPSEILSDMLEDTSLDYVLLSSGTFMLIKSPKEASRYANFSGVVYDRTTGEPLDGANVMLADASTGTATNGAGKFTLAPLLSGKYEVTVTYVGYKAIRDTVNIPVKGNEPHKFYMEARPVFIEPLVVSTIQPRMPYYTTEGEQVSDLRSTNSTGSFDAIRSIHSVMGTNFSLSVADLHIQGGSSGDHQVLLDGTPVYNPVSLGRLTGAFSPYALKKITVHKAGFGAEVGSQLSGIVDISQDVGAPSDPALTIQADPLNLNARANVATEFDSGAKLRTMVAARSNIWSWYQKPSLEGTLQRWDRLDPLLIENLLENSSVASNFRALSHTSNIDFYDLHLRSQLQHNQLHTTDLSLYQGKNYLQTKLLSHNSNQESDVPDFMFTQDRYDWLNTVASLRHDWLITPRLNATFRSSLSRHRSQHHFAMANSDQLFTAPESIEQAGDKLENLVANQPHTGDRSKITEKTLQARFDYSLLRNHFLSLGIETSHTSYSFSLSDPFYHPTSIGDQLVLVGGFLEDKISLGFHTKLEVGSRFTFAPGGQKFFAEPRVSLQYDKPGTDIGYLAAKISGGIYRQFTNQFDLTSIGPSAIVPSNRFWLPADFSTNIPKAYHAATELLVEPTEHLSLRWEGYYKWQPTTLHLEYHALLNQPAAPTDIYRNQASFVTGGSSYSYGSGVSVSRFFESLGMETMISYQYSVAKQQIPNRFGDRYIDTPWNKPHKLTGSVNWNVFKGTLLTLRWQGIWGRSWGFKRAYYDYLTIHQNQTEFDPYSVASPENDQLAPYYQLDLGLSYERSIGPSEIRLQANLVNLLGRENILEKQIVPQPNSGGKTDYRLQERMTPGFTPSMSLEFSF